MYLTEIFGGLGKLTEPTPKGWTLYINGLERIPDQPTTPWSILTNGRLAYGDVQKSRFNLNLGEGTSLTIPIPANKDDSTFLSVQQKIEEFLSLHPKAKTANFYTLFDISDGNTGLEEPGRATATDVTIKSWPVITSRGVKMFQDNKYQYFGMYERWFDVALDEMQKWFTEEIIKPNKAPVYDIAAVGLGALRAEDGFLKCELAPGMTFEFFTKFKAMMSLRKDRYKAPNMKVYMFYLMLLAEMLRQLVPIENYNYIDYMCMADVIVAQNKIGDNNFEGNDKLYDMKDIKDAVRGMIGQGFNEAFPWNKTLPWKQYFAYQVIKGWVLNRISAQTDQYSFTLIEGDKVNGLSKWMEYTVPQLQGVGQNGGIYFPMATNTTNGYLFLPMLARTGNINFVDYKTVKERSFSTAEISRGEATSDIFEPGVRQQEFIKLVLRNDARRWEITYADEGHVLMLWRFEISSSFELLTPNQSAILLIFTEFTGSASTLADGYYVRAGSDMLKIAVVSEKFNSKVATMQTLDKQADTNAPGTQMATPQDLNPSARESKGFINTPEAIPSTGAPMKPNEIPQPTVTEGDHHEGTSDTSS
jgi:hypothetical protein